MRIGILQTPSSLATEEPGGALQRFVRISCAAEELGFWSTWSTEHHFGSDRGYRPHGASLEEYPVTDYDNAVDPLTLLSYVAAKTTRLRLGTGVVIVHWDHPVRSIERAAMVDALSGGRLELGVGRGAGFREQTVWNVPLDNDVNNRRYQEIVRLFREAWSGEEVAFEGEFFSFPKLILMPKPVQQPCPLWIGSASLDSAVWAARQGLPYATITWPLTELSQYTEKRDAYRAAAAEAGHDWRAMHIPHVLFLHCAETDEEAQEAAYKHLMYYQWILEHHYEFARAHANAGQVFDARSDVWKQLDHLARFPIEHHIVGSPETCRRRVEFFQRELDVNYIVLNVGWGLMPEEQTLASLELFSNEVMPHFADAPTAVAT